MKTLDEWVRDTKLFEDRLDSITSIPVSFLENCDIAHKTIAELMGGYNLETMYGGDIVNWILEEYREKYESNISD